MRWQRTTSKDKTTWVAVDSEGNRIPDASGKFTIRYDSVGGCAYYTTSRATLDKRSEPEELPDGWPADSPQGIIARFCYGAEAQKDWAFLDDWKRRRNTSLTHAGCGENGWTNVPLKSPLTCPRCGVLRGDEILYAQWYTVKDPKSEGVRACVLDAWITGKRYEYMAGNREMPAEEELPTPKRSIARRITIMMILAAGFAYLYYG